MCRNIRKRDSLARGHLEINKQTLLHDCSGIMSCFCSARKSELDFLRTACGREDSTTKLCPVHLYPSGQCANRTWNLASEFEFSFNL